MNRELTPLIEPRRAPRWLHVWAILVVVVTCVLLALGGLVTSKDAGMSDPLWPTSPWHLVGETVSPGNIAYVIEHTHRIAAFTVGGLAAVFAIGAWWTDATRRWLGVGLAVVLLVGFGQFHREMRVYDPSSEAFPLLGAIVMGVSLGGLIVLLVAGAMEGRAFWRLRALATLSLVFVMIQGLLGGFRVKLNPIVGPELAMYHGIFAQLVFCLLLYTAIFTGPIKAREVPYSESLRLWRAAHWLVIFAFLQLIWGAWLRHMSGPLPQRLHLLTAFLVIASGVWFIRAVWASPSARRRLGGAATFLGILFVIQIGLGVEAWLGKFGPGLPLPELQVPTDGEVAIRTAHTFIGAWVLATSVVLLLLIRRASRPAEAEVVGSQP